MNDDQGITYLDELHSHCSKPHIPIPGDLKAKYSFLSKSVFFSGLPGFGRPGPPGLPGLSGKAFLLPIAKKVQCKIHLHIKNQKGMLVLFFFFL